VKADQEYLRDLVLEMAGRSITDDQGNALPVVQAGGAGAGATTSNLNAALASQTAAVANPNRKGFVLVNDVAGTAGATAYVFYGSGASSTSYTYPVSPGTTFEMPEAHPYTGIITVAWSAALGVARITELS